VVTDKQTSAKAERVVQQGRQGMSFTRMHQVVKPVQRFSAFGLSTDKSWWSAGDLGVKKDLPESIAKGLMVHLDPTPICSYQARWKERTYKGEVEFQGQRAHQVIATWADDTTIELWFSVSTGLLMGTRTQIGDQLSNTMSMTKYETHAGIQWPGEVISERVEASLKLAVAEKLRRLEVGNPTFRDVGPNEVAALLQAQSEAREKAAPEKK
jgi:hypothetical protein